MIDDKISVTEIVVLIGTVLFMVFTFALAMVVKSGLI
jgi:hypothetical protein